MARPGIILLSFDFAMLRASSSGMLVTTYFLKAGHPAKTVVITKEGKHQGSENAASGYRGSYLKI